MLYTPFSLWSCCLDAKYASVLNSLAHLSPLVPVFITKVEYQLLWTTEGEKLTNKFVSAFDFTFGLTPATIEVPGVGELEVYLFDVVTWAYMKDAFNTGQFDCASPCLYRTFSE